MTMVHDGDEGTYRNKADRKARKAAKRAARAARKAAAEGRGAAFPENPGVDSPSLLDALRERPGSGGSTLQTYYPTGSSTIGRQVAKWEPSESQLAKYRDAVDRAAQGGTRIAPGGKVRHADPMWAENGIVCKPYWQPNEYRAYERLTALACSPVISERAWAEVQLRRFVEKHGREKCDMMMAEIRRRDAAEWFKENQKGKGH